MNYLHAMISSVQQAKAKQEERAIKIIMDPSQKGTEPNPDDDKTPQDSTSPIVSNIIVSHIPSKISVASSEGTTTDYSVASSLSDSIVASSSRKADDETSSAVLEPGKTPSSTRPLSSAQDSRLESTQRGGESGDSAHPVNYGCNDNTTTQRQAESNITKDSTHPGTSFKDASIESRQQCSEDERILTDADNGAANYVGKRRVSFHDEDEMHYGALSTAAIQGPSKKPRIEKKQVPVVSFKSKKSQKPLPIAPAPSKILLLSRPGDNVVLSPLHTYIRQHIEVFTATEVEISQPAPGRKNPIQLGQVGLRCIHCRHLPVRERVKRAVCYPSSVGRVYHSVSDMKFDHFSHCQCLPVEVKKTLSTFKDEASAVKSEKKKCSASGSKASRKQSASSTAQYYHDSARQMGMVDGPLGVFMVGHNTKRKDVSASSLAECVKRHSAAVGDAAARQVSLGSTTAGATTTSQEPNSDQSPSLAANSGPLFLPFPVDPTIMNELALGHKLYQHALSQQAVSPFFLAMVANHANMIAAKAASSFQQPIAPPVAPPSAAVAGTKPTASGPDDKIMLATVKDSEHLNSLHCFVRRHIEVFAADDRDVSSPSPGRKQRVHLGQVGIRCIHCVKLPLKDRVKRSVCYPPSLGGLYHAVSNMKFDHFGNCRGLPASARDEFAALRATVGRKSVNSSSRSSSNANSTAQYYHDSALQLGLVDTDVGIRFKKDLSTKIPPGPKQARKTTSKCSPKPVRAEKQDEESIDGISALMIAATDPKVREAYEKTK